jgi:putative flavoprotein involved in K+ transport
MPERFAVAVIGAGQATSHHLTALGIEHVVIERARVGETWRSSRWDSFTFVTPNWTAHLPGHPYDGHEPDGFTPGTEIVGYFERYAAAVLAPVRVGIQVGTGVEPTGEGGFRLHSFHRRPGRIGK